MDALTAAVPATEPSPPLAASLLVAFGFIGVMAWIVADVGMPHGRSVTTKVAHGVMVVVFGACIVAGALLT